MKFLSIFLLLFSCSNHGYSSEKELGVLEITLDDKLINSTLYLTELDLWFLTPVKIDSFKPINNKIVINDLDPEVFHIIKIEDFSINIFPFLDKKTSITIIKEGDGKIKFISNQGSLYEYWSFYKKKYQRNGGFNFDYKNSLKLDHQAFINYQENHFKYRKNELDSMCLTADLPESFQKFISSSMLYEREAKMLDYFEHHYYYLTDKESFQYYVTNDTFYNRFSQNLYDDYNINLMNYALFVESIVDDYYFRLYELRDPQLKKYSEFQIKFSYALNNLKGKTRDLAICLVLKNQISRISDDKSLKNCRELINEFDSICVERKFYKYIENYFYNEFLLGTTPEFCLTQSDLVVSCLSNWKGNNVVLYFTATWCIPCKKELPIIEKISKENPDIIFLSVSLENDNFENWKKNIPKKTNLKHLYAEGGWNSEQLKKFNLNSVPRFILINSKGEIVNANASYPSNDLTQDIEKYFQYE